LDPGGLGICLNDCLAKIGISPTKWKVIVRKSLMLKFYKYRN
jgi:hypothetical protein